MKIAVIGGGSSYTPELMEGLLDRARVLGLDEVALHDLDPRRLEIVAGFSGRMAAARVSQLKIVATTDLERAVAGASFIIAQVRVGGNAARRQDELLCRRHGLIGQETTGVGGLAKALRTVPALLAAGRVIESVSPEAVLVNFTNPSGLVTEALLRHTRVQTIGLCNLPITFQLELARELGIAPAEIELDYIGLNHLAWVRQVRAAGKDVTGEVLAGLMAGRGPADPGDVHYPPEFIRALNLVPMYYLRYYYLSGRMLELQERQPKTRAEEVMEIESELFRVYADPAASEKPAALSRRGGAHYSLAALELIEAIHLDRGDVQILNVMNRGTLPGLPDSAVIETRCRVDRAGARPLPLKPAGPEIMGLMAAVKAYEQLVIQAAVEKDYAQALLALVAHPLGPDADRAQAVLDDIIATHGIELMKKN